MEAFLTGFAIAFGVNLFIFPVTSRTVVFKEAAGYIQACQGVLKAQAGYLQSLEKENMFDVLASPKSEEPAAKTPHHGKTKEPRKPENTEATRLKGAIGALIELHGKLSTDLTFAKREMAYGNLSADDIDEMFKLFRRILFPMTGMSSVADIFERVAERRGWVSRDGGEKDTDEESKKMEKKQWNEIMRTLHTPFAIMTENLSDGFEHVLYTLELKKKDDKGSTKSTGPRDHDVEARGNIVEAGEKGYALYLTQKIDRFYEQRKVALAIWCKQKGINLDADTFNDPSGLASTEVPEENLQTHQRNKRQLYLILYVSLQSMHSRVQSLPLTGKLFIQELTLFAMK